MNLKCFHCNETIYTNKGELDHTVFLPYSDKKMLITLCHRCFLLHFDYKSHDIVENIGLEKTFTKDSFKKAIKDLIGEKNYNKLKIDKPINKHFEELIYED